MGNTEELDWGRLKSHERSFCASLRPTESRQTAPSRSKVRTRPGSAPVRPGSAPVHIGSGPSYVELVPHCASVIGARDLARIKSLVEKPVHELLAERFNSGAVAPKSKFSAAEDSISGEAVQQPNGEIRECLKNTMKEAPESLELTEPEPLFVRDPRCTSGYHAPLLRIPSRNRAMAARPPDADMSLLLSSKMSSNPLPRQNTHTQKTSHVVIARCAGVPTPLNMKTGGPGIHSSEIASLRKLRCQAGVGCQGNFEAHLLDAEEEI